MKRFSFIIIVEKMVKKVTLILVNIVKIITASMKSTQQNNILECEYFLNFIISFKLMKWYQYKHSKILEKR